MSLFYALLVTHIDFTVNIIDEDMFIEIPSNFNDYFNILKDETLPLGGVIWISEKGIVIHFAKEDYIINQFHKALSL